MQIGNHIPSDVFLKSTHANHFGIDDATLHKIKENTEDTSFKALVLNSLNQVNSLERTSLQKQMDMVTRPDEVSAHEVFMAQTQAELAISFAKAISSRMISAYKELENLR